MKSRHKLSKNCSTHGENCEISGPHNFWTSVKTNIPNVWNWIFWSLFGSEIEVAKVWPLWPPQRLRPCLCFKIIKLRTEWINRCFSFHVYWSVDFKNARCKSYLYLKSSLKNSYLQAPFPLDLYKEELFLWPKLKYRRYRKKSLTRNWGWRNRGNITKWRTLAR